MLRVAVFHHRGHDDPITARANRVDDRKIGDHRRQLVQSLVRHISKEQGESTRRIAAIDTRLYDERILPSASVKGQAQLAADREPRIRLGPHSTNRQIAPEQYVGRTLSERNDSSREGDATVDAALLVEFIGDLFVLDGPGFAGLDSRRDRLASTARGLVP